MDRPALLFLLGGGAVLAVLWWLQKGTPPVSYVDPGAARREQQRQAQNEIDQQLADETDEILRRSEQRIENAKREAEKAARGLENIERQLENLENVF